MSGPDPAIAYLRRAEEHERSTGRIHLARSATMRMLCGLRRERATVIVKAPFGQYAYLDALAPLCGTCKRVALAR